MTLDDWSAVVMGGSTLVVASCLIAVFTLEGRLEIPLLVLGHGLAMVGAVGIKIGYIMRLESRGVNGGSMTAEP